MLLSPFQWEASFAFNILSIMGASVQFAPAATLLILGPLLLLPGWEQPQVTVLLPFPKMPPQASQTPKMLWVEPPHPANTGPMFGLSCVLCSFGFCEDFCEAAPIWTFLEKSLSWLGRGIARRVAWLGRDRSWMHSHWDQKYPWSHVVHSIRSYEPLIWPFSPITLLHA